MFYKSYKILLRKLTVHGHETFMVTAQANKTFMITSLFFTFLAKWLIQLLKWYYHAKYGCSFVAKLIWKNICFFSKNICFLQNIYYLQKKCFYMEKKVLKFFLQKKTFFTEKNINENVKIYLSFEKYILMQKMFVLQIKYKSFLNICSFCKKNFFDHRNYIC